MTTQTDLGTVERMVLAVDDLSRATLEWGERDTNPPGVFLTNRALNTGSGTVPAGTENKS